MPTQIDLTKCASFSFLTILNFENINVNGYGG